MRKGLVVVAILAALAAVPALGLASDIPDGQDCRGGTAPAYAMGSEMDRGAYCVHAGGVTVLYIGGEAQSETQDPGMPCGAIIVADMTVAGTDDWDNASGEHCD